MSCKKKLMLFVFLVISHNCSSGKVYEIGVQTPETIKKIYNTVIKQEIRGANGKKYIAYIYSDHEQIKKEYNEDFCHEEKPGEYIRRSGEYYIYLYDVDKNALLPKKTRIFGDYNQVSFGPVGYSWLIFPDNRKRRVSDVLLISQFGTCNGDDYEAYGLSTDGSSMVNYVFKEKNEITYSFFGYIKDSDSDNSLYAYQPFNFETQKMSEFYIHLSDKHGEIELEPIKNRIGNE